MAITGDLVEFTGNDVTSQDDEINMSNILWELTSDNPIPVETLALYSIDEGIIIINELNNEVFDGIKNSIFSHIFVHIYPHDKLFILFFEFCIEKRNGDFEFVNFGISPTTDFISILHTKPVIKIRDKFFHLPQSSVDIILEKLIEFKTTYPNNSLFSN